MSIVPLAYVRLYVDYDPDTGIFTGSDRPREHFQTEWEWLNWRRLKVGMPFGENIREGKRVILPIIYEGVCYSILASHVAFAFTNGRWPLDGLVIDHKNRDPRDDRIRNLREVTDKVNASNQGRNPLPPGTPARISPAERQAAFAAAREKERRRRMAFGEAMPALRKMARPRKMAPPSPPSPLGPPDPTIPKAAEMIGVSDRSMRRLVEKGEVEAYELCGTRVNWRRCICSCSGRAACRSSSCLLRPLESGLLVGRNARITHHPPPVWSDRGWRACGDTDRETTGASVFRGVHAMSTYYRLCKRIKADELFDGRLEAFGVREEVRPGETADQFPPYMEVREVRYLTNGRDSMEVVVWQNGYASLDVRDLWCAPEKEIFHAIAEAFDTEIVTEHQPENWGFDTQEEWDAHNTRIYEEDERKFHAELLKHLCGEPNGIGPGTIGMMKAEIAKSLVEKDPSLMGPEN